MKKYEKYFWMVLLIIVGVFVITKMYAQNEEYNREVCEVFWNDVCYEYNIQESTCYCERENYLTTSEMIKERNELMQEMARQEYKPSTLPKVNITFLPIEN